jgi:uncharacterized protein
VFLSGNTYATEVERFGLDKVRRFAELRQQYGEPELAALSDATGYAVV